VTICDDTFRFEIATALPLVRADALSELERCSKAISK
jgi:hypothetical protein